MSGWKLFLDNNSEPTEKGWTVCTCINEAIRVCDYFGLPNEISFGQDLGTGPSPQGYENNGYGFAKWLRDSVSAGHYSLPDKFTYHVVCKNLKEKDNILDIMNNLTREYSV